MSITVKLCVPAGKVAKEEAGIRTHVFEGEEYKEYPMWKKVGSYYT